ncbi:hypothetical protein CLU79DRAFT_762234 [Phycomyces nitens]|nr:hypothetical protein CLU79DRAFT_762234 [Phycomyces nitens]
MGQARSKPLGSLTFGHFSNTITIPHSRHDQDDDLLLRHPSLYGLSDPDQALKRNPLNSAISTQTCFERADSGYLGGQGDLTADLVYIDQTYYGHAKRLPKSDTRPVPLIAMSFAEVATLSLHKAMKVIQLSSRTLTCLSSNIGLLTAMRKLDLSYNQLTELPKEIGYLQQLEWLSVASNRLTHLPDTIAYLNNLLELDLSENRLEYLPASIGHLKKLQMLLLPTNSLRSLPVDMAGMVGLSTLDLSHNPLDVLPAEIICLQYLRRLRLDDCPLLSIADVDLAHNPPSLKETCARIALRHRLHTHPLSDVLVRYLTSFKSCSCCGGPYWDTFVVRKRLIERNERRICLEYRLCSAHWTTDSDRILQMFGPLPSSHSLPPQPTLPPLLPLFYSNQRPCRPCNTENTEEEEPKKRPWRSHKKITTRTHSGFLNLSKLKRASSRNDKVV